MTSIQPHWRLLKQPVHFFALGFGSGLSKFAPGTFGTLAAIPLYLVLAQTSLLTYSLVLLFCTALGFYLCGESARRLGSHDHGAIVWDEICGYLLTMWALPVSWFSVVLGFVLFRIFDILKPWPISYLDKHISGGVGIMLDDLVAAIFALLLGHGFLWLYPDIYML